MKLDDIAIILIPLSTFAYCIYACTLIKKLSKKNKELTERLDKYRTFIKELVK